MNKINVEIDKKCCDKTKGFLKDVNIVVIDDEYNIHDVFQALLGNKYNIICFYSPIEGIDYIRTHCVNLVFLDYAMPVLDGLETACLIKKAKPAVPIVMFTGRGSEDVAAKALKLGIKDYIKKPFSIEVVKEIEESILKFTKK